MKPMRRDPESDPRAKRDLDAVDAAMRGETLPDDLADLGMLTVTLQSERPVPREQFLEALDRRVDAGFAAMQTDESRSSSALDRIDWWNLRRFLLPALAGAASVAVVAVGIGASGVLSGEGRPSGTGSAPIVEGARQGGGQADGTAVAPEAGDQATKLAAPPAETPTDDQARPRRVERAGSLTLAVPGSEIEQASDDAIGVVDRYQGFVLSSSVSSGSETRQGARLELRVPSRNAQAALADLSQLGHVRERSQSANDITGSFSSLAAQRKRLEREVAELRRRLAEAGSAGERQDIRFDLRGARERLQSVRSQQRALDRRVQYSSLSVAIVPDEDAGSDGKLTPGDALDDAGDILGAMLGAAVIALAIGLPIALVGAALWLLAGRAARNRREKALDDARGDRPAAPKVDR